MSRCTKLGDYGKKALYAALNWETQPANWVASAFKWETTRVRTQSPHLVQSKIVLKEETPSRKRSPVS